jgi:hypothetical protein
MNEKTKKQIIKILMGIYHIPGEFAILGIVSLIMGNSMIILTNWAYILVFLGYILIVLEIISPFIIGIKLYKKAVNNIRKILNKK